MTSASFIFAFLLGGIASVTLLAGWVYFVGIPEEWKKTLASEVLENMGENMATDALKSGLGNIPDSNNRSLKDAQKDLGDSLGDLKKRAGKGGNPLGGLTDGFGKQ
jgi:putative Mn2+ efflux pump MntP